MAGAKANTHPHLRGMVFLVKLGSFKIKHGRHVDDDDLHTKTASTQLKETSLESDSLKSEQLLGSNYVDSKRLNEQAKA